MIRLVDETLGVLELGCAPFVVASLQISRPAPRVVEFERALDDGVVDDTFYTGKRAITASLRLNENRCNDETMQDLYDLINPYLSVKRRPVFEYWLPGKTQDVRRMLVRGDDGPMVVADPRHPVLVTSWVCPDGQITSARGGTDGMGQFCQTINPSGDTEAGREYDLEFDREYPPSQGVGERIINVGGNENAHWRATLYGAVTNPTFRVNGIDIVFASNGGLALTQGQYVTIDTRERTILFGDDPTESRYNRTNYAEWSWSDLLFKPGENRIRYSADVLGDGASVTVCWRQTWG